MTVEVPEAELTGKTISDATWKEGDMRGEDSLVLALTNGEVIKIWGDINWYLDEAPESQQGEVSHAFQP